MRETPDSPSTPPAGPAWQGRALALEGCRNFRDMGGYAGEGGAPVRWRKLFRSGRLDGLTGADQAALGTLNLDHVFDFRQDAEREREPSRWGACAPRVHALAIVPGSAEAFFGGASEAPDTERTAAFMEFIYRDLALHQGEAYGAMFRAILDTPDATVLLHCAAGKDRTGFGSALLLSALGVGRADILEDYLLTGRLLEVEAEMAHVLAIVPGLVKPPMTRASIRPMFEVRAAFLASAFSALEEACGTVEGYLASRLGVGEAERRELRRRYLVA